MGKRLRISSVFLGIALLLVSVDFVRSQSVPPQFRAPHILTASDIAYPLDSVASGLVSLEVQLDAHGRIAGVNVLRDIPSLTGPAKAAVHSWTFAAAALNGQHVASTIHVHVIFNPAGLVHADNLSIAAAAPASGTQGLAYTPPQLQSAGFANYPPNGVGQGGVVLSVPVTASGIIGKVQVLHAVPGLTQTSVAAARLATFAPATFQNVPVRASVVLAYVFRVPNVSP